MFMFHVQDFSNGHAGMVRSQAVAKEGTLGSMFARLNEAESLGLIGRARVARLGCIVDGGPYVVPINCYYDDGCIYSHSLPGQKISALRENPKACLQFDE